eukprot:Plantae.Rhodophyta-Purpureofilum_apyrenoidigerum.ctg20930.p1 GENE.Plantae.Rhodophyta-Purpureofilum_apyrenoidigerum.ctg20930~~Plantae.Rhodophyta-Purpureofilum_apyrenoidigerum.ctg20930.p1  ORF type:complete len:528 (+),score=53.11 Plantae.Rhodophyta-Purpureofilum_apyrenoidigerum.ctg20930:286-1869(+)
MFSAARKALEQANRTCRKTDVQNRLTDLRKAALLGGGSDRLQKQHGKKKLSARERLTVLLDLNSFRELDQLVSSPTTPTVPGDGVVTGRGKIFGRTVMVFSQDFTVSGGTLSEANARKICKVMDRALELGCPVIGINDSGGARIQEGVGSLAGYTEVFKRNVQLSGVVPQLSLIMGPCAGGAVYSPALTDFTIMVRGTSHMFVTGPDVIAEVLHEKVGMEDLGGAKTHTTKSGVSHFSAKNDFEALTLGRDLMSYLPSFWKSPNSRDEEYAIRAVEAEDLVLDRIVPSDPNRPYDMIEVVERIVDRGTFFQVQRDWAKNIVVGFGRLSGNTIGIVANQPKELAGVLDINASTKAARFVRFCDAFSIPILTLVDVPGFLPGTDQEWNGIIRHGAKLLYAYAEATTPKVTVITRKAYGGAYCVMSSKHLRGDFNYCWPTAEIAVLGSRGAAKILAGRNSSKGALEKLRTEYQARFANPLEAAKHGYVDAVIVPRSTRQVVLEDFKSLSQKCSHRLFNPTPEKKHGSIPL